MKFKNLFLEEKERKEIFTRKQVRLLVEIDLKKKKEKMPKKQNNSEEKCQ